MTYYSELYWNHSHTKEAASFYIHNLLQPNDNQIELEYNITINQKIQLVNQICQQHNIYCAVQCIDFPQNNQICYLTNTIKQQSITQQLQLFIDFLKIIEESKYELDESVQNQAQTLLNSIESLGDTDNPADYEDIKNYILLTIFLTQQYDKINKKSTFLVQLIEKTLKNTKTNNIYASIINYFSNNLQLKRLSQVKRQPINQQIITWSDKTQIEFDNNINKSFKEIINNAGQIKYGYTLQDQEPVAPIIQPIKLIGREYDIENQQIQGHEKQHNKQSKLGSNIIIDIIQQFGSYFIENPQRRQ